MQITGHKSPIGDMDTLIKTANLLYHLKRGEGKPGVLLIIVYCREKGGRGTSGGISGENGGREKNAESATGHSRV